jgi:hypothetical protein
LCCKIRPCYKDQGISKLPNLYTSSPQIDKPLFDIHLNFRTSLATKNGPSKVLLCMSPSYLPSQPTGRTSGCSYGTWGCGSDETIFNFRRGGSTAVAQLLSGRI